MKQKTEQADSTTQRVKRVKTGGTQPIVIDYAIAENAAKIMCTGEEIAGLLDVDYDTLGARIKEKYGTSVSEWLKKYQAHGRASLRRSQFMVATKGNPAMLIWLGKQHLNQSDKTEYNPVGDTFYEADI